MIEIILGVGLLVLGGGVLYLGKELSELKGLQENQDFEVDKEKVQGAVSESWQNLELGEKIKSLEKEVENVGKEADQIEKLHQDIQTMLENPKERGEFGERKLEDILSRHLPSSMYSFQGTVAGKRPDAFIESSSGKVCIDSKFPLSKFRKMQEAETKEERESLKKKFRRDVKSQLDSVESKYVRPDSGTTDYAFEFVPSERVYYYLVKEEYDILDEYAKKGVQLVSPLTLGQKLELVKNDVHTAKLSQKAEDVQQSLKEISNSFSSFESEWETYRKHIKNAKNSSDRLESEFEGLKQRFERVNDL
ncbi:DNA recombination protein RmuC [Candidatus Nanohalobium constans]|uniref:DNA recombination protein RmuC n=1 Tax=Candidatus Nanohalobium constans TaxID=2565781 RepID=A0A5Q0UG09_9ARCH|nr:DNA recombination protein RmuC [Candidatus Nanohalobium constans]QGA80494.1 DNA recombination protein RmuC [Candidatus Nanohalobium constans]